MQFLPADHEPPLLSAPAGHSMDDAAVASLIRNLTSRPLWMNEDEEFRISVAGAQEKTALLKMNGNWHQPVGATPTTHILKPAIGRWDNGIDLSNSVENEHFCLAILGKMGLPAANTEILMFENQKVLAVERFDRRYRKDGLLLRLPQEDCCQALGVPPSRKYQNDGGPGILDILELLKGGEEPEMDRANFLRTNIIFWLLGATDGHAKNFSVFLLPGGRYHMTPLYDVISVQPTYNLNQLENRHFRLAMRFGDNNKYRVNDIIPRHILQTAKAAGMTEAAGNILEGLRENALAVFDATAEDMPVDFPEHIVTSIRLGIEARLRLIDV